MEKSNVISLRRARRRFANRRPNWHPITGHRASVIAFPQKIRAQGFAHNAGGALNRRAAIRRKFTQAAEPVAHSGGGDGSGSGSGDDGDCLSTLPYGVGRDPFAEVHSAKRYDTYPQDTSSIVAAKHTLRIMGGMAAETLEKIRNRMAHLGLTQEDLTRPLGVKTRGAVGHYLNGRREMGLEQIVALAEFLKMDVGELLGSELGSSHTIAVEPISRREATDRRIGRASLKRVPVVGTASLGLDGFWEDLQYPPGHGDGYFEFPTEDAGAYVLQVKGTSMHPAIRSGWYVVVEPGAQTQMGEFVLVKLTDGRSTVKELLWHRDGEWVLNAVNGDERLIVQESQVIAVQHIGGILPPSSRQI